MLFSKIVTSTSELIRNIRTNNSEMKGFSNLFFLLSITLEIIMLFLLNYISKKRFSNELKCTYLVRWIENHYK